jgi:hypothetical protein
LVVVTSIATSLVYVTYGIYLLSLTKRKYDPQPWMDTQNLRSDDAVKGNGNVRRDMEKGIEDPKNEVGFKATNFHKHVVKLGKSPKMIKLLEVMGSSQYLNSRMLSWKRTLLEHNSFDKFGCIFVLTSCDTNMR